ncbi:MAG: hypothetical protein AAGC57_19890 [Pseudomonadota bacterium]
MRGAMIGIALALAAALTLSACGKRGSPRPPAPDAPVAAEPAEEKPTEE